MPGYSFKTLLCKFTFTSLKGNFSRYEVIYSSLYFSISSRNSIYKHILFDAICFCFFTNIQFYYLYILFLFLLTLMSYCLMYLYLFDLSTVWYFYSKRSNFKVLISAWDSKKYFWFWLSFSRSFSCIELEMGHCLEYAYNGLDRLRACLSH